MLEAWKEFLRGKRKKRDVQEFGSRLMDNVLDLHRDLREKTYRHGSYHAFKISDPKPRDIHKASVRDRLLHHALYRKLYPFFDRMFIADSYSCRDEKGTHKAMNRFREFAGIVSKNYTKTCWVLKCDIKKFFANIDHAILQSILEAHIVDEDTRWLLGEVIFSFQSQRENVGLPLGNLTSQLLVNVYMNEFDHYMKREMNVKYYIRYADDFVILSESKTYLEELLPRIENFLRLRLKLNLHPDKVSISTFASGVDFLGWVHFLDHRVLRTSTKRRMMRNLAAEASEARITSYHGMLSHGNAHMLAVKIPRVEKIA